MKNFKKLFGEKPVIGMIHVDALPGTPRNTSSITAIIDKAVKEAETYKRAGISAVMIENMHDVPYIKVKVGPEITACMTAIGREVKKTLGSIPCGVQVLAAANKEALAVAQAAGLDFIRAEGYVFGHVADEGYIDSCAAELMRYRKMIGAEDILVFTDIKKKHSSHAITADVNIIETAHAAEFFMTDGVIVTGISTGHEADLEEIRAVKKAFNGPVLVGSGVTLSNMHEYLNACDGIIIGSHVKEAGNWKNSVSPERTKEIAEKRAAFLAA